MLLIEYREVVFLDPKPGCCLSAAVDGIFSIPFGGQIGHWGLGPQVGVPYQPLKPMEGDPLKGIIGFLQRDWGCRRQVRSFLS